MGKVLEMSQKIPHLSGAAICTECKHVWAAVNVAERDAELMECPSCSKFFGVFRGPLMPEVGFVCNCGSKLFYLTPDGHQCRSCGVVSLDWCNT